MESSVTLGSPWWLALLALFPVLVWQTRRGLSGLDPGRRRLALALRLAVLTLLALALADLQLVRATRDLTTLFVLDQSLSIPPDRSDEALEWIGAAMARRARLEDQAGLVVFGKDARLELPPAPYPIERVVRAVGSRIDRQYSDLAGGIRLALGSFPPDAGRRIVLISDGNQNRGDVLAEVLAARSAGVTVDVVPIEYRYDSEVLVDKVVLPPDLKKGDTANLRVVIRSARPATGRLRLRRVAGKEAVDVAEQRVELRAGLNVLHRTQTIAEPNFYTYEAVFEPDPDSGDRLARNNQASAFTWIRGEGQILLIEQSTGAQRLLAERLRQENLQVTVRVPDEVEENLADLRPFDCVIVADVPAESLGEKRQELLAANTRDLGAGLVMVGGPDSFGAGGYVGSVLEKALPVDMTVKATKVRGKGALVLIMHACEIEEGNYWQKKIARLALGMLSAGDECGLVYWNGKTSWLIPLQPVGDKERMYRRIDGMTPGDMPDFESSMDSALDALRQSSAMTKHVIIISDGDPQPPTQGLLAAYRDANVTCTTVAVAAHGAIEERIMRRIAAQTRGRYYQVTHPKALPQIYIKETRVVSRPLLFEQEPPWQPVVVAPTEPVAGMPEALPAIGGYVLTTPKPNAEVPVVSPLPSDGDVNPIVAHWQFGLGRAVAFTTDAGQKWAVGWPSSELFGKFWSQLIRWTMRGAENENLSVSTQEKDGKVTVVVNALDKDNDLLNFLALRGVLIRPDVSSEEVSFRQTEPGKYELEFPAEEAGSYFLRIGYQEPDGSQGFISTGLNIAYPPEYRDTESNRDLLENIATVGGGRLVEPDAVAGADFFPHDQPPTRNLRDAWPILLLWALVTFLVDVGVRRISLSGSDVWAWARRVWSAWTRRPLPATEQVVERLRVKKSEIGAEIERKRRWEASADAPAPPASESVAPGISATLAKPLVAGEQSTGSLAPGTEAQAESYMERLLKVKKKTLEQRGKDSSSPGETPDA